MLRALGSLLLLSMLVSCDAPPRRAERVKSGITSEDIADAITVYLQNNFGGLAGGQSVQHIRKLTIEDKVVIVHTDLRKKGGDALWACRAVSGYIFSSEYRRLGLRAVKVLGGDGAVVAERSTFGWPCE